MNCRYEATRLNNNRTLKNWILIPIDISKELAYYADSKYIRFIKFSLTHQNLQAWENLSNFLYEISLYLSLAFSLPIQL
jgi:hypothetical protein